MTIKQWQLPNGMIVGPAFFSKSGAKSSALFCPPVWAFDYGVSSIKSYMEVSPDTPNGFQVAYNSVLDSLISDILVYLENRLKLIVVKDKIKFKINSVPEATKAYKALADIKLEDRCNLEFLKQLDRARGDRHHTHNRYDVDYKIGTEDYETKAKVLALIDQVQDTILSLEKKLQES